MAGNQGCAVVRCKSERLDLPHGVLPLAVSALHIDGVGSGRAMFSGIPADSAVWCVKCRCLAYWMRGCFRRFGSGCLQAIRNRACHDPSATGRSVLPRDVPLLSGAWYAGLRTSRSTPPVPGEGFFDFYRLAWKCRSRQESNNHPRVFSIKGFGFFSS